jgi:hypothetical protein
VKVVQIRRQPMKAKGKKKSLICYAPEKWYLHREKFGNRSIGHSWLCAIKSPLHPKKVKITIEELK